MSSASVRYSLLVHASIVLSLAGCRDALEPAADVAAQERGTTIAPRLRDTIPYQYIITLHEPSVDPTTVIESLGLRVVGSEGRRSFLRNASPVSHDSLGGVFAVYRYVMNGFAARLSDAQLTRLRKDPRVAAIEPDTRQTPASPGTQVNSPWHLDRIDQRDGMDGVYGWDTDGSGVRVYIIDSGIDYTDPDLGGRVDSTSFFDFFSGNGRADTTGTQNRFHGTGSASMVVGTYGVAKGATVHSVKVWRDGSFPTSQAIAGFDWVRNNHVKPAIANYSAGGPASTAMDNAATALINAGVTLVTSAGNENVDACTRSPARVQRAVTVGAVDEQGARAFFLLGGASNFGPCVDLFAPGTNILAARWTGQFLYGGTSAASPIVAGVAARFLSRSGNAFVSPEVVENHVRSNASPTRVSGSFPVVTAQNLVFAEPLSPVQSVLYNARVQNGSSPLPRVYDSMIAGTTAQGLVMRGFSVLAGAPLANAGAEIRYQARFNGTWQPEVTAGAYAGSNANSGTIRQLRIRLATNPLGNSICYQVHQSIVGWGPMACDGATAGDPSYDIQAYRIYVFGLSSYGFRAPSSSPSLVDK